MTFFTIFNQYIDPLNRSFVIGASYNSTLPYFLMSQVPLNISKRLMSSQVSTNKYITTPIFYVNAAPHIGHLYTAALADTVARYNSMHYDRNVLLTTGTDEHGNKVQRAAKAMNLDTSVYCEQISRRFREMCDVFDIGYTDFIRTTEKRHEEAVHHFWNVLQNKNYIYLGKYCGWYCTTDEAFISPTELKEQKNTSGETMLVSAESGNPVEWTEEQNYKFRLSAFRDDLKHWLKDENVIQPSVFYKILSQWVEDEKTFEDLSISRPKERAPWGILTPGNNNQTIYVWFDALVNYLSSLGYPNESFKKCWPPDVQIIGKDILKFHGIFWPAFLIAADLEPPRILLCHSHWTIDGEKMSKSRGNVISPFEAAKNCTPEGLRYYLLRDSVPHNDADYTTLRVSNILNAELADNFGNLVNRCISKAINPNREFPDPAMYAEVLTSEAAVDLRNKLESLSTAAQKEYEKFYIHHAVDLVMMTLQSANRMINHHEPWNLRKNVNNTESYKELMAVISLALESARISALVLFPVIPQLSSNLLDFLGVPSENRTWHDTKPGYLKNISSDTRCRTFREDNLMLFKKLRV